ncbi:RRQRL motif-containing zinc-binding protein [Umezawaea beigongshangensis]|uniref:RRQRL motif-containing zinc-binding protein n=1 Tax=Umezawaea beigongshangensis TaxID=2780383 RepID=UPI0018F21A81|nr:RRQRL motif-containing zinc-binding protein [Umezawaea beigongshangensis]
MGRRQYPWVMADVPWSDAQQFTRGTHLGLPLLSWGIAPRHLLATRRQLRAMNRRPGGHGPVALLYLRHNASKRKVFANLYLIAESVPCLPMTPAKWTALAKANLARRICGTCGKDVGYVVPTSTGLCWPCFEADDDTTSLAA